MNYKKDQQSNFLDWQIERIDPKHTPWFGKKAIIEHRLRYNLAKGFIKNRVVIDLGCGVGYGTYELAKGGARKLYGIDIDNYAIRYAKEYYGHKNITYNVENALNTKLSSRTADVVIAFEVIEHMKNPKKFLHEVSRLLKPNGIFIMSTPNRAASFGDNPYHIKEFTFQELTKALSIFKILHFYGQHRTSKIIFKIYKTIANRVRIPFVRQLLRFRPWESPRIKSMQSSLNHTYLYFVVVCEKKIKLP